MRSSKGYLYTRTGDWYFCTIFRPLWVPGPAQCTGGLLILLRLHLPGTGAGPQLLSPSALSAVSTAQGLSLYGQQVINNLQLRSLSLSTFCHFSPLFCKYTVIMGTSSSCHKFVHQFQLSQTLVTSSSCHNSGHQFKLSQLLVTSSSCHNSWVPVPAVTKICNNMSKQQPSLGLECITLSQPNSQQHQTNHICSSQ